MSQLCVHRDMKHLGSLESTQEARVANSYASFVLSKLRACSSVMLSSEPLNVQPWHFLIAFLSTAAASYTVFISEFTSTCAFSAKWMAESVVFLKLTLSDSHTRTGLRNSISGISLSKSYFNALRLYVGLLTLFVDMTLSYASCNVATFKTSPSVKCLEIRS